MVNYNAILVGCRSYTVSITVTPTHMYVYIISTAVHACRCNPVWLHIPKICRLSLQGICCIACVCGLTHWSFLLASGRGRSMRLSHCQWRKPGEYRCLFTWSTLKKINPCVASLWIYTSGLVLLSFVSFWFCIIRVIYPYSPSFSDWRWSNPLLFFQFQWINSDGHVYNRSFFNQNKSQQCTNRVHVWWIIYIKVRLEMLRIFPLLSMHPCFSLTLWRMCLVM